MGVAEVARKVASSPSQTLIPERAAPEPSGVPVPRLPGLGFLCQQTAMAGREHGLRFVESGRKEPNGIGRVLIHYFGRTAQLSSQSS